MIQTDIYVKYHLYSKYSPYEQFKQQENDSTRDYDAMGTIFTNLAYLDECCEAWQSDQQPLPKIQDLLSEESSSDDEASENKICDEETNYKVILN